MGFFSPQCRGCSHPLLCTWATNRVNGWMTSAVVIDQDGNANLGEYDGYGRLVSDKGEEPCTDEKHNFLECWHSACWHKAGAQPHGKASSSSEDQGWFFDQGLQGPHTISKPSKGEE